MKVSHLLSLLLVLSSIQIFAQDTNTTLESYISDNKQQLFELDYQKSEAEASKLRDSWIAPLNLSYSHSTSNPYEDEQTSQNAAIKMDQPIFASGGIYYGIKFAQATKIYSDYSVDVAKRKMIKDAISILMQIKQSELRVKRQELQIKNSEINLEQKKEQYMNGQLDSGFLDNAIIERNFVIQALYDIQTAQARLISSFEVISDLEYKDARIPHLELLSQEEFLEHNIVLRLGESEIERNRYNKNVTIAKYLPRLHVTAGYNWSKSENSKFSAGMGAFSEEKDYYDYGLRASMPLDFNTFRDIESVRVDYLKSQISLEDTQKQLNAMFDQVMQNIENLEKKKALSLENKGIYDKLLADTNDLYLAGYKTEYDVNTLKNSVEIQELDSRIYEIDRQLELLSLYEMYVNGI
jgi:outer membrane protein TolC